MLNKDQINQNAALLDMDIQQEEINAFLRDYWKPIVAVVIFLIVVTAGVQVYRAYAARQAGEQMAGLLPMLSAAPSAQNAKALESFAQEKASGGRRALAMLYAAQNYQAAGKPEDARRMLQALQDSGASSSLRDYAAILSVNSGGDVALLNKIGKSSPWQTAADEIRTLSEKDAQKRQDGYARISAAPQTPAGMRERAKTLSGQSSAANNGSAE